MADRELMNFLENQLTERRQELFRKVVNERTRYFTVAVENIYQSHNASAVVRSCECFGIQDLHIIEKENAFKTNTGIVMGADKWVDMYSYKDSKGCIDKLKSQDYRIIATSLHKDNSILEEFEISQKTAFFFGEESVGLSKEVIDHADGFLKIPMVGFTESFNISVTVALVLHFLTLKLRKSENINWKLTEEEMVEKRIEWATESITKGEELVKHFYSMKGKNDIATFGAGCFWCVEAIFQDIEGVISVTSGYSGGSKENPSYKEVCIGNTGHAEVTQIVFDKNKITFDQLLEIFWQTHDPTTLNRQGNDAGTQYRSVIFYHSADQKDAAEKYKAELNGSGAFEKEIITEIVPFKKFFKAEDYHQDYFDLNGDQPYCTFVIQPKIEKFRKVFKDKLKSQK